MSILYTQITCPNAKCKGEDASEEQTAKAVKGEILTCRDCHQNFTAKYDEELDGFWCDKSESSSRIISHAEARMLLKEFFSEEN